MGYTGAKKRAYQREWVRQKRAEYFSGKQCVDCSSKENLELDHVNPADKIAHSIWSWSPKRIAAETAKCVVRCANCHAKKTTLNKEHAQGVNHGNSKLTTEQVDEIRDSKLGSGELSKKFGVHRCTIWTIRNGTHYKI